MIFNNQLRSFVYLALDGIQNQMRPRQRTTKFAPNRQTQEKVCFHIFESENNQFSCLQLGMYKVKEVKETNYSYANNLNVNKDDQFID